MSYVKKLQGDQIDEHKEICNPSARVKKLGNTTQIHDKDDFEFVS